MKKSVEIILETIHVGSVQRIVTLGIDGKDHAKDFLLELAQSNRTGLKAIRNRFHVIAELNDHENEHTFKRLKNAQGLYEVKTNCGLGLYCFRDGGAMIIAAFGGKKNGQTRDIRKAEDLMAEYQKRKKQKATIQLIP